MREPAGDQLGQQGELLLDVAEDAIEAALAGRRVEPASLPDQPGLLRERHGSFVTLHVDGQLNGCIGSIEGEGALADDLARLAVDAALSDPRLPRLRVEDLPGLEIEVSVLSSLEPLPCATRQDLLAALRPGRDGLVIGAGRHRGVFLPDVWQSLPEPDSFLDHLMTKAGLRPGSWPPSLWAQRFTTRRAHRRWSG